MEILRDSIWQFVGAIVAVTGIVAAVWIYRLQKTRKMLSYKILASNELLTAGEELRGIIKVTWKKKPIQNVHLLVMQFTNDGNAPIAAADFYEPVKITFGEETKVISVEKIESYPESFNPSVNLEGQSVLIVPTLINSGDSFTIKFLLAQYTRGNWKISGRIQGISQITKDIREKTRRRWRLILAALAPIAITVVMLNLVDVTSYDRLFMTGTIFLISYVFYLINMVFLNSGP